MRSVFLSLWLCAIAGVASSALAHEPVTRARTPVRIPDLPGYLTLKCDFHIHTVFSDGLVWPSVRAEEAWREGLDAIAITDHIEYQPHKADVNTNHNRSYEIAGSAGANLDLIVVKGSEVTRKMPPGHLNAIFLANSQPLATADWRDALKAAQNQDAFIFWNHPDWEAQTTNGLVIWYPEHTELLEQGFLKGIEVVNGRGYCPEAHQWAMEKKLTMLSNSDIHQPLNLDYHVHAGDHRPITLVFARERSTAGIKEALLARRTAVYAQDKLIGEEQFLRPIFENSVRPVGKAPMLRGTQRINAQVHNDMEIDLQLTANGSLGVAAFPGEITLAAGKTVLITLTGKTGAPPGKTTLRLPYKVKNFLVAPNQPLQVTMPIPVEIQETNRK
jgi:hypothetical protein